MSENIRSHKGMTPESSSEAYVDPSAVVIGDVKIGADSGIWPCVSIRGDVNHIQIGERTNIQDGSVLHVTHKGERTDGRGFTCIIGNDVTVGHKVLLHGCTLEDACFIGMGSMIMDGAVVETGAMLAAGSLVTEGKRLEAGYLYLGAPAKKIRPLTDEEKTNILGSAQRYAEHAKEHLEGF